MGNGIHRTNRALCYLWVPLCIFFAGPATASSRYDTEMVTIQAKIAEKEQALQSAERRKAKANSDYNKALEFEPVFKAELTKRSKDLKYQAKRMDAFKTWNIFVTFVGGANSLIQKVNPGTAFSAAMNFLADRAMEAGGNAPMKAKMTKLKNTLSGESPAQMKLMKVLNMKRSEVYSRLKKEGKIPKDTYYEDYMTGKHDALLITSRNRYLKDAIDEAIKETDDTLAGKPWEKFQNHYQDLYNEEGKKIDDLKADIADLDRKYKEVALFKKAWQEEDKKQAAKKEAVNVPPADEPPAKVKTFAPRTGNPTTVVKGQVIGKNGTITTTETYRPDGSLIDVIDTTTDPDGKVVSTTTYKNGTGEGITTTTAKCPAGYVSVGGKCVAKKPKSKPGKCTSDSNCATGYVCDKASGKCVSPFDGSYGSFTRDMIARNDQRDQKQADQNANDQNTGKRGYSSDDLSENIDDIQDRISISRYKDTDSGSGYQCEDGACMENSAANVRETTNDAALKNSPGISSETNANPSETQSPSTPGESAKIPLPESTGNTSTQPNTQIDPPVNAPNDTTPTEPSGIPSETNANPPETQSPSTPGETAKIPSTGSTTPPPTQSPNTQINPPVSPPAVEEVASTPPVDTSGDWIRRIEEAHDRNDWQGLLQIYTELVAANTNQYQERYITKAPYLQPFRLLSQYLQEFAEKKWDWFKDDVPGYLRKVLNSSGDSKTLREVIQQAQKEHPAVMQKMFDNQGSPFKILSLIQEFIVKYRIPVVIRD